MSLPDKSHRQPVAWRYRYRGEPGEEGEWRYVDSEDECNTLLSYEREPLFARSATGPHLTASATLDHSEVILTFRNDEEARAFYASVNGSSDGKADSNG